MRVERVQGLTTIPTLADECVLASRIALICAPHVARLNAAVHAMSATHGSMPYFDPLDGGQDASVLILLEAPGPGSAPVRFVSRDNPGRSQRNLNRFLGAAGLARADTVLWNTVPWLSAGGQQRALRRSEIVAGITSLMQLLPLMPALRWIILAGRVAQKAGPILGSLNRPFIISAMPHPSPRSLCSDPGLQVAIERTLRNVAMKLRSRVQEPSSAP